MLARMTNDTSTRRNRSAKARQRRLDEAFKWLMADARGRLLMWDRLAHAGVFHSSMSPTPELTAFHEGRRDLGLRDLGQIMRLCPEHYLRMAAEAEEAAFSQGDKDDGRDDRPAF